MKPLLIAVSLLITIPAVAANAPQAVDKGAAQVAADRYFLSAQCGNYLDGYTDEEKDLMLSASEVTSMDESLRYVTGKDSILGDFQKTFSTEGIGFNKQLVDARKQLEGRRDVRNYYSDDRYSEAKAKEAFNQWKGIAFEKAKPRAMQDSGRKFIFCRMAVVATGMGVLANYHESYVRYAESIVTKAQIGYFEISADRGQYAKTVGTGNRFSEPKTWEGSRFFIVSATFKNLDTESRMPIEGSLFITYNGKEYEFDSVEPISTEGYNLWFRKINPLITMKTKIVYRIPDEISGPVFWRPGRNAGDTKLWLGYLKAHE